MLAREFLREVASLHLASELLLTPHVRHEPLVARRLEPWRIDPAAIGVPDIP